MPSWYIKIPPQPIFLRDSVRLRFPHNWPLLGLTRTSFQRGPLLSPSLPSSPLAINRSPPPPLLSSFLLHFSWSLFSSQLQSFYFPFSPFFNYLRPISCDLHIFYSFPDSWVLNFPHSPCQLIVDQRVHFDRIKVSTLLIVAFRPHRNLCNCVILLLYLWYTVLVLFKAINIL
jgi:hypothetical protein